MIVLNVEKVRKSFREDMSLIKREVLHGISFQVYQGEVMGFLGPNGAGKSTTIKIILGLLRPDSGRVVLFDSLAGGKDSRRRIGYLPENPYFFPHLTLVEFLTFCGQLNGLEGGELKRKVNDLILRLDLEAAADLRLKGFSKGMIQRAGLAQAILHNPDLLILDEPFSGLDPLGRVRVRDILIDFKRVGKTIFFSSHILPDMEDLCDRATIIRDGMVVKVVGLDELMRIGEGMYEITARSVKQDCIDDIAGYLDSYDTTGEEIMLVVKEHKFVRTVIQHLYNRGAEVLKVVNQHRSLEKLFLEEISAGDRSKSREIEKEKAGFIGF
jgi:ABC-2 type transport system ATP-binding protein